MAKDTGIELRSIKVDGGASKNNFLMQFQADITKANVQRSHIMETTALGAAYLAGIATGFWKNADEVNRNWKMEQTFLPSISSEKRESLLKGWQKAVRCVKGWAKDI